MIEEVTARKKAFIVKALRWDGSWWTRGLFQVQPYCQENASDAAVTCSQCSKPLGRHARVNTLEDWVRVCPGDWIIRGVRGDLYPCKDAVFQETYEVLEAATITPQKDPMKTGLSESTKGVRHPRRRRSLRSRPAVGPRGRGHQVPQRRLPRHADESPGRRPGALRRGRGEGGRRRRREEGQGGQGNPERGRLGRSGHQVRLQRADREVRSSGTV